MYNNKEGEGQDVHLMTTYLQKNTPPDNYKIVKGVQINLQKPSINQDVTLKNLFQHRGMQPLDITLLSRLLYYAFGQTGNRHMRVTGAHIKKTIPSGGSRHPLEVYLIIRKVPDLSCGIYHYQVKTHSLILCQELNQATAQKIINDEILLDQNRPGFPYSVALLYSCVFARSMYRYRESRSYRVMHYDLGHLTQNLCFMAQSYGLDLYSGYSCHENALDELIGLDSYMEPIIAYSIL
jgi:SagB-type dehydrogenase family enzyme